MLVRLLALQERLQDSFHHFPEELGLGRGFETYRFPAQRAGVFMQKRFLNARPAEGMSAGRQHRLYHNLQANRTAELLKGHYCAFRHPLNIFVFEYPLTLFFLPLGQPLHNTYSKHLPIHNLHLLQILKLLIGVHLLLSLLALGDRLDLADALAQGLLDRLSHRK